MDRVLERVTEGPMLVTRTSLLISATAAIFVMAAHTGAEAGFLCQRGMGSFAKYYKAPPQVRVSKAPYTKPSNQHRTAKAVQPKAPAKAPVENPTKSDNIASAKPASIASAKPASEKPASVADAKPADIADATASTPIATATDTCLVKEYLDTGVVRFRDVCTKEWAVNSIDDDAKASKIRSACLTKKNNQNGVVMFKDVCTGEWAMNTAKQIALASAR
jgi:hypothetical protein